MFGSLCPQPAQHPRIKKKNQWVAGICKFAGVRPWTQPLCNLRQGKTYRRKKDCDAVGIKSRPAHRVRISAPPPVLSTRTWKVFVFDGGLSEGQAEDKRRKGVSAAAQVELSRCYAKDVSPFFLKSETIFPWDWTAPVSTRCLCLSREHTHTRRHTHTWTNSSR